MSAVCLGLTFYVPIVLGIHYVVHHYLLTLCTYNSYTYVLYYNLYAEDYHTLSRLKNRGTKKRDGSSQKLMFESVLSLLQPLKGGANGIPESVVTF